MDESCGGVRRPAGTHAWRRHGERAAQGPELPPAHLSGGEAGVAGAGDEHATGSLPAEADPLVSNGLGSPLCRGALGPGELSVASRRDCETSGFVAAVAPTGNYGIDVHIDTGLLGLGSGEGLTIVQDLFVTPLWMAIVWSVHTLVVMLEWCFTIDLLDSTSAGVGGGLRRIQAAVTEPWLATVLAVASVLALYDGLIRRRVAETLGQALLVLSMMTGGMWVILDPTGTVGALSGWANQASLGTLAVTSSGSPAGPGRALANSMGTVFSAAIEAPWCYLEFGDVDWCRDPGRRDPRLRQAGLKIAASELAMVGCNPSTAAVSSCVAPGSAQGRTLEHSAELLRGAQSNGALFLALPANGPARNSINEAGSLLRVMCQGGDATRCSGPTAAQAQFRTNSGTWPRVGGLLLIVAGVLGMLLLLGFIVLRLLAAAIFGLLFLLLAPVAVLAPALGEGGRAVFRRWAAQLLGAVVSKLIYSFLLGVVLAVLAILAQLRGLGWWTQWLLMSAFWWGAYARRHQAFESPRGTPGSRRIRGPRPIARRARDAFETSGAVLRAAGRARDRRRGPAPDPQQPGTRAPIGRTRAQAVADVQAGHSLDRDRSEAGALLAARAESQARILSMRAQLMRVRRARIDALTSGDARRAARLAAREERIEGRIVREQHALTAARRLVAETDAERRRSGAWHTELQREERARFLDAQAALPARGRPATDGERRDYVALAGLAGHGRAQFEALDTRRQRQARLQIDRELALRRELRPAGHDMAAGQRSSIPRAGPHGPRDAGTLGGESAGPTAGRLPEADRRPPGRSGVGQGEPEGRLAPGRVSGRSTVLDDAREVAAGRKRQLGRNRP